MANPHSNVSLTKFSGLLNENWSEFESQLRRVVDVANVVNAQRSGYLQLHLAGEALQYYLTLEQAVRDNFEQSLISPGAHFNNPNLTELHLIKLETMKYDQKTMTAGNFLVKLHTLAKRALPDPVPQPVAPLNQDNDRDRFVRENRENQNRQQFAIQERDRLVCRLFKCAMPNWIRIKLLEQPADAPVRDLCDIASRLMVFNTMCPSDDVTRDSLNEVSPDITNNLVSALSKLSETKEQMKTQLCAMTKELNDQKSQREAQNLGYQANYSQNPHYWGPTNNQN